jgi:hypothetical protein
MNAGTIRFKKRLLFLANSLKQQVLGLENRAFPSPSHERTSPDPA